MFDFVREKKLVVQVILAAIVLPFAFWGVDSYQKAGNSDALANVNDAKITQQEFDRAFQQQMNAMREKMAERFDATMFETPEAKRAILDALIMQKLLVSRAKEMGVTVTDQQMAQVIQSIEAFQENGQFSKKRYDEMLASQNMNQLAFEARLFEDLLGQQARSAYAQNGFASNAVIDNAVRSNERQWIVSVADLPFQSFMANTKVDDAEIKKYYEQNQKEFQSPEQVKVEYVKFSKDTLMAGINIPDQEVEQYYKERSAEFAAPEQRQASHILISAAVNAPKAEQDAAKKKAEDLLAQLKQNPAKFAELAKQHSQDPLSAEKGGDLGMFGKGMMVKPFEDAVFSLKQDELSSIVKTDFGYHIIKVTAIQAPKPMEFAEVKAGIAEKMRQQKAADLFAEKAEKFNDAAYTQSDSLKAAAELVGAKIEQSDWLLKGAPDHDIWNAKMMQAIFSDEVIKNKRNTAATEVAENTLVAARVLEHKPAAAKALAEVQELIRLKLQQQQAEKLATEQGDKMLALLKKGEKAELQWLAGQNISRSQRGAMDGELLRKVFQVDRTKLPQYVGMALKGRGYSVVRIDQVKEADKPDDNKRARYAQQIRQMVGEEMLLAYMSELKAKASIKVNMPDQPKKQ